MNILRLTFSFMLVILLLTACENQQEAEQPSQTQEREKREADRVSPSGYTREAIAENNRGVGLMGRFDYPAALTVFEKLAKTYPEIIEFQFNRAVATLNRQLEGDEASAIGQLEAILAIAPNNINAHYVIGLLKLRNGDKAAADHLQKVLQADPDDAYAAYFLAQSFEQQGISDEALKLYKKIIDTDPYLRSAYYAAFLILRRTGDREQAKSMLQGYQKLATNPRAQLAEYKYTRMGNKANVLTVSDDTQVPATAGGELFGEPLVIASGLKSGDENSITVTDINGDGIVDLFLTGASFTEGNPNSVLLADTSGTYSFDESHPLASIDKVNAALWGDVDNDGLVDVYLCRQGENQLWKQTSKDQWENVTQTAVVSGDGLDTVDGAIFDADHDGDLDIYTVNANGPNELFNNNLDGSFRRLAQEKNIAGNGTGSRSVLVLDIDNDRDTDIVVVNNQPPHSVYINDRLWAYRESAEFDTLKKAVVVNAIAADIDADGHPEIYTLGNRGEVKRWMTDVPNSAGFELPLGDTESAETLAILDVNGDGLLNMLIAGPEKWQLVQPGANEWEQLVRMEKKPGSTTMLVDNTNRGLSLVSLSESELLTWPPGRDRLSYATIALSGLRRDADSMRSNASGIGTRIAVRQGSRWTLIDSFRHSTGPGQSLQPIAIGLGGQKSADFISLTWSDGVFQTELALEAGKHHQIAETQRQLSSCPVLFAWNGTGYAFISDILGVGGMGYMVAPGEYAPPRPHENLLLPVGALQTRNGRFALKIGEPMEEAAYIDAVRLIAYDLPPGFDMVLDERMGILGPQPTGENIYFNREQLPTRAVSKYETDVLAQVLTMDLQAPEVGELDKRFIGRLKQEQELVLEFDQPIDSRKRPVLMIDGWVEYPYSQTMFAAWQANAGFDAPSLDARDANGTWRTVLEQFGYPAGMPRRMALPLDDLPEDTQALRLRTNQEIYWDRVSIVYRQTTDEVVSHRLPLVKSRVADSGFALRTNGEQRQPHYNYAKRAPLWDTRHMSGYYTRFGDSTKLVAETDDAVAIIGPGEEVHIEFDDTLPSLEAGWTRRFVVESNGWAKDMDLFTGNGETIDPLPSTGKSLKHRDALHASFNTRYRSGP